jgi:nicotinamidase-related amidase
MSIVPMPDPRDSLLNVRNSLLVVVDMQLGFLNHDSLPVIPAVLRLLGKCEGLTVPIVFTKFINRPASPFETLLDWKRVREKPETDLHELFHESAHNLIEKNYYTAFTEEFDNLIQREDCRTLLIAGISTESCVLKTALDAFERGLRPIVVSDACASDHGGQVHLDALELMKIMIGMRQVKTIDEVLKELTSLD